MIYLPDTNACVALLRGRDPNFAAHWKTKKPQEIILCSVVVYELRHGAERSTNPEREHSKLDTFLAPYSSLPFDDAAARQCASIRFQLERIGWTIGPHDLQIAAIALQHRLTLVTHNSHEFCRIPGLVCEDWEK